MLVNPTHAGRLIRKLAREGRYRITDYCAHRMLARGVAAGEVRAVLASAREYRAEEHGRWRVDGEELTLIVEIRANVIVVTVFRGDEDEDE